MSYITIASYEVLAQPIAPVPNVPFVTQGAFLQISNLGSAAVVVESQYIGTPSFVETSGNVSLDCNYIDQTGTITAYSVPFFLDPPIGFGELTIPAGATWLFGVQYLLNPGSPVPTTGVESRGFIQLQAAVGSSLLVLATTRQVFNNYNPNGTLLDVSEAAYPVPLATGPVVNF